MVIFVGKSTADVCVPSETLLAILVLMVCVFVGTLAHVGKV